MNEKTQDLMWIVDVIQTYIGKTGLDIRNNQLFGIITAIFALVNVVIHVYAVIIITYAASDNGPLRLLPHMAQFR